MLKKLVITLAKIVKTRLVITVANKTIFGTFAMTSKAETALLTLLGQKRVLQFGKLLLSWRGHHLVDGLVFQIAKLIFRVHKMVAGIHVAVKLHHARMPTFGRHRTQTRSHTHPVGQRGIEQLHVILPHIIAHPLVEDGAKKVAPLFGRNRKVGQLAAFVHARCEPQPVVARYNTFNNGRKLNVTAPYLLKEMVKIQWIIGIKIVHHGQCVPLHPMLIK